MLFERAPFPLPFPLKEEGAALMVEEVPEP